MKNVLLLGVLGFSVVGLLGCGGSGGSKKTEPGVASSIGVSSAISSLSSSAAAQSSSSIAAASSESLVSSQSSSSQMALVQLTGTVAVGRAIVSGTVQAICADGSGFIAPVTTDAQGQYVAQVAEGALPCFLQVSEGDPEVVLHSYAFAPGNVNISPLTDLVLALYFKTLPADKFAALKAKTCNENCTLENGLLVQAEEQLMAILTANGYLQGVNKFSPATTSFAIGDAIDRVLDKLQEVLASIYGLGGYQALLDLLLAGGLESFPSAEIKTSSSASSVISLSSSSLSYSLASSSSQIISSVPSSQSSQPITSSSSVSSELQSSSSSTGSSNNQSSSSVALLEPEMVVIPAGSFQMGNLGEGGLVFELPVHTVTLNSFAMSKYEITFAQYDAFAVATGRELPNDGGWGRGNRPVINVNWDDATAYVAWISQQTGKSYRLATEAEWEYAGRAGSETVFSWGNEIDCTKAQFFGDQFIGDQSECGTNSTAIVGSYAPNAFGLHDMHGNVYEWTQDCYNNSYNGAPTDGSAWMVGDCGQHSVRGGSWSNNSFLLRSAYRGGWPSTEQNIAVGFRVAQDLNNQTPSNPINGAWVSTATCNWESPLCDSWLIFLTGDKYFSIQTTQPDEGCTVGIELGSYTLNPTTGAFRPSPQIDTNDHCGVSDASESASVIVDGNQLSYKEAAGLGSVAFMKSPGATDYQGTWVLAESNRTEVLVITGGDYVLGIYDAGVVDVERGNYSYNSATGAFVVTQFKQDKNSARGFTGASNIKLQVSGVTLTITTDLNPSNPQVFSRLQ